MKPTQFLSLQFSVLHRGAGAKQGLLRQAEPPLKAAVCSVPHVGSQLRAGLLFNHSAQQRGLSLSHIPGPAHTGVSVGHASCPTTHQEILDDGYYLHRGTWNVERHVWMLWSTVLINFTVIIVRIMLWLALIHSSCVKRSLAILQHAKC